MKRRILPLFTAAILLTGCSGDPENHTNGLIEQKKYSEAMNWLKDAIAKKPDNLLLNALLAETAIHHCISTNCFDNAPTELKRIKSYLEKVPVPQVRTEEGFRQTHNNIFQLAQSLIGGDMYPKGVIEIAEATPAGELRNRFVGLLFNQACAHLAKNEVPPAMSLLESAKFLSEDKTPINSFSPFLMALASDNKEQLAISMDTLRQLEEGSQPPQALLESLPYLFHHKAVDLDPVSGTSIFLEDLPKRFTDWIETPLQSKNVRHTLARIVKEMAAKKPFMDEAIKHMAWGEVKPVGKANEVSSTDLTQSEAVTGISPIIETSENTEDATHTLKLRLLRTAITLHPQNEAYWSEFLPPAISYVKQTGETSILFSGASAQLIPTDIVKTYNQAIFELINELTQEQKNILPLVSKIIIPQEEGDTTREQAGNMIKRALDEALEAGNYDLVQIYSENEPEIARLSRQKIVTVTIDALEKKWDDNEFSGMAKLANFLSQKMGIDFSLDSLLLQSFDEHLKAQKLNEILSASTIDPLLIPAEEIRMIPDAKLLFLRTHFSETPEVIDNILKSYIVKAEGNYGTANALYQMFDLFDAENFPESERLSYLGNSIKTSFSKDETLNATQVSELGYKLHQVHNNIPLIFIAGEVVNRITTLDEARNIWLNSPEDLRNSLEASRPQFSTLMRAVEAYENNDRQEAATLFTLLTNAQYKEMAKPYIQEYVDITSSIEGIYGTESADDKMSTSYIHIKPVSTMDNIQPDNSLLSMDMTFVSSVGRVLIKSPQDLTEDYSKVFTHTLRALLDPDNMEISIDKDARNNANLPQSFDKVFGSIKNLRFVNDRIILTAGPQFYTLNLMEKDADKAVFPQGKFGIISVIKEADENVSQVLPLGSIFEFKIQKSKALRTTKSGKSLPPIYPVKGIILNPAVGTSSIKVEGFYSPERHTLSLSYALPLGNNADVDAALRCQIIETFIQCAAHNKLNSRERYGYLTSGRQIEGAEASAELKKLVKQPSKGFSSAKRKAYLERQKRQNNEQ